MRLDALPPNHEVLICCELCGERGSFTVAELIEAWGADTTVDQARAKFAACPSCKRPMKVERLEVH